MEGSRKEEGMEISDQAWNFFGERKEERKNIRYTRKKAKESEGNARRSSCVFSPAHEKSAWCYFVLL